MRYIILGLFASIMLQAKVIVLDSAMLDIIDKDAQPVLLYEGGVWLEGPAVLTDGSVVFSDVRSNKILRYIDGTGIKVIMDPSHFQNGHTLDNNGNLLAASHGKRSIEILSLDSIKKGDFHAWKTLVKTYEGKKFNSPNDLIVDSKGDIWFSDPAFGLKNKQESYGGVMEQDGEYVYRYSPKSKHITRLHTDLVKSPNGLALSNDERILYIADSNRAYDMNDKSKPSQIVAYRINADGSLGKGSVFAVIDNGIPDGIRVDSKGNVYSSSADSILVFSSDSTLIGKIDMGGIVGNMAFANTKDGKKIMYITAGDKLYKLLMR